MKLLQIKRIAATASATAMLLATTATVFAAPPGAQLFNAYDNTNNGLDVSQDPDIGNVEAVANPGGQGRLVIQTHLQKAAPNCTYNVELVSGSTTNNGGLDEFGHSGWIANLGTLTTNKVGNGNAHFDVDLDDIGWLDIVPDDNGYYYAHLDFEAGMDADGNYNCYETENDPVINNEYGAAPDPNLSVPFMFTL